MIFSRFMRLFISILLLGVLAFSGCYDNHKATLPQDEELVLNCKIGELRQHCNNGCYTVVSDFVCVGRVTSSDKDGNFYRSLFIEDETGSVELLLGSYNLHTQYPLGLEVALYLKGMAIALNKGVVQVGLPPQSHDSSPREMEAQEVIDKHLIRSEKIVEAEPLELDIASLDTSLCGRLVRVGNISHLSIGEEREYYRFEDNDKRAIFVYVSNYSSFAIPLNINTITGILLYESVGMGIGEHFVIKPRFEDDCTTTDYNN